MDPLKIIQKYYKADSLTYRFLTEHSRAVAKKARALAARVPQLKPDMRFIEEAAMLHDIGIFLVNDPEIGCFGDKPYLCHGYLGRALLESEGLPRHALVAERHVGTGITEKEIRKNKLPLPERNMLPISAEEEIICLADKFFSKNEEHLTREKSPEQIRKSLVRFGEEKVKRFDELMKKYAEN